MKYIVSQCLGEPPVAFVGVEDGGKDVAFVARLLHCHTVGFLKEVPVEKISEYEAFLYETLDARYAGLLAAIRTAGKLEKETEQQLASAIAETVSAFLAVL